MSFKNEDKIMDFLKENKDKEFKVTEIAEQTKIDIKNMGRYIKQLEEQQKIKVRPVQEGKVRTKFVSFAESPKSEIQADPPGPAAIEKKEPEPPKPKIRREPKESKAEMNDIPEFDDLIKFCFERIQDADCQTFLAHNLPPRQERALTEEQRLKLGIAEIRKGGGHSGATKIALTILRKMRNQ
jgi:DNA-binding MarR family transcriptional regulator